MSIQDQDPNRGEQGQSAELLIELRDTGREHFEAVNRTMNTLFIERAEGSKKIEMTFLVPSDLVEKITDASPALFIAGYHSVEQTSSSLIYEYNKDVDEQKDQVVLWKEICELIGAGVALSNNSAFESLEYSRIIEAAIGKYHIYQHKERQNRGGGQILQLGDPRLRLAVEELDVFDDYAELKEIIERLQSKHTARMYGKTPDHPKIGFVTSAQSYERGKVLEITMPFSIEAYHIINPTYEMEYANSDVGEKPIYASGGSYCYFGQRVFTEAPISTKITGQTIQDGELSNIEIICAKDQVTVFIANQEVDSVSGAHPGNADVLKLSKCQLEGLDTVDDLEVDNDIPTILDETDISPGNAEGIYTNLYEYYRLDGRPNPIAKAEAARADAKKWGAHYIPEADGSVLVYVPGYGPELVTEEEALVIEELEAKDWASRQVE